MSSVFLSHSWEDKFFTRRFAEKLREAGVKVWLDEAEMRVGDSLIDKISSGIAESNYVAAILSKNSVASRWVNFELKQAMNDEIRGKSVKVLPIIVDECTVPPFLADKLYVDFRDPKKFDESFSKVLAAIEAYGHDRKRPQTPSRSAGSGDLIVDDTVEKVKVQNAELVDSQLMSPLERFVDLKITGVAEERTYQPDPSTALYNVYLELSNHPPSEWVQIFHAERRFPRHSMWRRAWVDGKFIVVHCCLGEIKSHHLGDLKENVANTNSRYRRYLYEEDQKATREVALKEQEGRELEKAFSGLNFD